mmetsp:Transcript_9245/g.23564  ORF Transcript_9245/g.23564 Transcript_9245/m.23564 type:complete len:200 (-) Transcript_9245:54-653(-)
MRPGRACQLRRPGSQFASAAAALLPSNQRQACRALRSPRCESGRATARTPCGCLRLADGPPRGLRGARGSVSTRTAPPAHPRGFARRAAAPRSVRRGNRQRWCAAWPRWSGQAPRGRGGTRARDWPRLWPWPYHRLPFRRPGHPLLRETCPSCRRILALRSPARPQQRLRQAARAPSAPRRCRPPAPRRPGRVRAAATS